MDYEALAQQLRKPAGDFGIKVAEKMNISNELMNRAAIEMLHVQEGDNILEIGMGNGFFVRDILSQNGSVKYTGCDFSETMVQESIVVNREFTETGRAKFLQGSADKLPIADNCFNKIFTVNTIYFWQNPATELAEIYRIIQPKGKFIIGIRPKHSLANYPFTQHGFKLYSEEELTALLESNNFRVTGKTAKQEPELQVGEIAIKPEFLIIVTEAVK